MSVEQQIRSRRAILKGAAVLGGMAVLQGCAQQMTGGAKLASTPIPVGHLPMDLPAPKPTPVARIAAPRDVNPVLFNRALAALEWHGDKIPNRDLIVIADFTPSSSSPRLQVINLMSGATRDLLVAHGSGSDPTHSGFLQRFSNVPSSECTSSGAFVTRDEYFGQHGKSRRLMGLDPTNNLAYERAIVVHGAWYSNPDMIEKYGKLGRSQGCFAVAENQIDSLVTLLGEGRMIYAGKA